MRARAFVAFALAALSVSVTSAAEEAPAAEALFREGKALLEQGDVAAACRKLAESQRADPSSGTLLNLAVCHERQGKTATAWAEYLAAARLARVQTKEERAREAERRAAQVEHGLSYWTLRMESPVAGLRLHVDGVELESSAFGSRVPVDPGHHRIVATAPGFLPSTVEVTIGERGDERNVVVPALEPDRARGEGLSAAAAEAGPPKLVLRPKVEQGANPASEEAAPSSGAKLAWAIGGSGLVLLAAGGVFGVLALTTYDDAKDRCPAPAGCDDPDAVAASKRAETFATLANVGIGVGLVATGLGAVLHFGSRAPARARRATVVPSLTPEGGGVSLQGAFP